MASARARLGLGRARSLLDPRIPSRLVLEVAQAVSRQPAGAPFDIGTLRIDNDREHVRRALNALSSIGLVTKYGPEWGVSHERQAHADLIGYDYARFSIEPVTALNGESEESLLSAIGHLPHHLERASRRVFGPIRTRPWAHPEIISVYDALRFAKRELRGAQDQPRAGDGTLRTATGSRFKPDLIDPHGDRGATLYQDPFAHVLEESLGLTFENAKRFDGSNLAKVWASDSAFVRLPLEALLPDLKTVPRTHAVVKLGPPYTVFALVTRPARENHVIDKVVSAQGGPLLAAVLRELTAARYKLPQSRRVTKVSASNINRASMQHLHERAVIICPSHTGVPPATYPGLSKAVTFIDPGATLLRIEPFEGRIGSGICALRSSLGAALTKLERDPTSVEVQLSPLMNRDVARHLT